jgi:hypothetical protein
MPKSLMQSVKITRVKSAQTAGTSAITCDTLDMTGFDGVLFMAMYGTLSSSQVTKLKAQTGAAANMSDAADLAGTLTASMADADDNKCQYLEILRPKERYIRCIVSRSTGNAVVDGVIAFQFRGQSFPTTQDATTVAGGEQHVAPTEGTA